MLASQAVFHLSHTSSPQLVVLSSLQDLHIEPAIK
jgi:hypothetical protein